MYAIIETGGKQYKVQAGDVVFIEKLDVEPEQEITFDKVMVVGKDDASLSVPPLSQEPLSRLRFSRTARLRKSPSSPTSPRRTRSASSVTDSPTPRWKFPLSTLNQ